MKTRPATDADSDAVDGLLARYQRATGRGALSEYKERRRTDGTAHAVVTTDGEATVGYAIAATHGDSSVGIELCADPVKPNVAIYMRLIAALQDLMPVGTSGTLWAPQAEMRSAAVSLGLKFDRKLATMERSLSGDIDERSMPDGLTLGMFTPGVDSKGWVAANAAAFADHPESGAISLEDLAGRIQEPWFDPQGFLVARTDDGSIVGYNWTKLHPDRVGEIYIIGVIPHWQGSGLGSALLSAGLRDLKDRQLATTCILYMDALDQPLVDFYETRGFSTIFETCAFRFEA